MEKRSVQHEGWQFRIRHIFQAIQDIEEITAGMSRANFKQNKAVRQAVVWNFNVNGEAVRHVPEPMRQQQPELPWQMMRAMRNVLVHDYDQIDLDTVWDTIEYQLPEVKSLLVRWAEHLDIDLDSP